ncbi:hypothetical protein Fmac_005706 [Flemingia macrophylla]|uniref:Uncharacterized protein n=1 Tax=Flemingia macrophylla TaxID=520843 RepID=A0ABD1N8J0_9FABA
MPDSTCCYRFMPTFNSALFTSTAAHSATKRDLAIGKQERAASRDLMAAMRCPHESAFCVVASVWVGSASSRVAVRLRLMILLVGWVGLLGF